MLERGYVTDFDSEYFVNFFRRLVEMKSSLKFSEMFAISLMLFALFFGAGNMIFPPALGQGAGTDVWIALFGFIVTGVGLPLLGVIVIALKEILMS